MCFKNIISQGSFCAQHDGIHKTNQKICFSNLIEFKYSMLPYPIIGLGFCLEGQSKFEQLSEILTKVENILTHWSVAQTCAVLNDEKNGGRKSLWTVPLIVLFCVFTWASPCLAAVSALLRPVRPP